MEFVLTLGTATSATNLLVALFKYARPQAASWTIAVCSLVVGISLALLVTVGVADVFSRNDAVTGILAGIFAAAGAAGISRADNGAEAQRKQVQQ